VGSEMCIRDSYLLRAGDLKGSMALARESQEAASRCGDHLHQAYAAAIEAQGAEAEGRRSVADRKFREAFLMLAERQAAAKLAELCAMYGQVLRNRGAIDRAFAFMRMAAERDFGNLAQLIRQTSR